MNWRQVVAPAALLAIMLVAGTVLGEEGSSQEGEIAVDVVEANASDSEPWVIAPNPTEAVGGEEVQPLDEASVEGTESERSSDDVERSTGDLPEDDTTIGTDDSDAKGEPLIAPAGDQEEDAGVGGWRLSHAYILIAVLIGAVAIGAIVVKQRL